MKRNQVTRGQILFYGQLVKLTPVRVRELKQLTNSEMSSLIGATQAKRGRQGALRNS